MFLFYIFWFCGTPLLAYFPWACGVRNTGFEWFLCGHLSNRTDNNLKPLLTNNATSKDPALYSIWEIFDTAWGVRDDTEGVDGTTGDGSPSSPVPPLLALEDGEVDPDLPDFTPNDDDSDDEEYVPTTQPEQTADADENDEYDGLAPKNLDPYLNDVSGDASEEAICPTQPSPMEIQFESDSEPGMSQSIGEKHVGHDIPMTREEFELTCETQPTEEHYPMETLVGHNESDAAQPTPPATGTEAPSIGTKDVDMMPPPPPMPDKAHRRAAIEQRMAELRLGVTQTQV